MKLNLDFYREKKEELLPIEEEIIKYIHENDIKNYCKIFEKDNRVQVVEALSQMPENILNWYEVNNDASVLQIGVNYGEITGMLCDKFSNVVGIEASYKKAKAISKRYEKRENLEIIVGNFENITFKDKFEYIVIYKKIKGEKNLKELIDNAKKILKENGKIFLATDNRFGIQNWIGKDELFESNKDKELVSEKQIRKILEAFNLRYKVYYVFSNYKMPNLIYDESYKLTHEDISRNFNCYSENQIANFEENKMLNKLIKENKNILNFFANSFLIEISENEINNDVRYITFTNYRKPEYQVMTIIKDDIVEKKAVNKWSQKHIDEIIKNQEYLRKYDVDILESNVNGKLVSNYIKNYPRLDVKLEKAKDLENFTKQFEPYIKMLYQNSIEYKDINFSDTIEAIREYDKDKLKKLKFLEYGFLDLIPKNSFDIDGKIAVFDQEWMIKYVPVEYLIYRAIRNSRLVEKFTEEIYLIYNLEDYKDLFEGIEESFRKEVIDFNILLKVFNRHVITKKELIDTLQHYKNLNEIAQTEKQNMQNEIIELKNQINYMLNSKSWKLTKPLRKIRKIKRKKDK